MEVIKIESTTDTPCAILDKAAGKFELSGVSFPEDVRVFYTQILNWLDGYVVSPNPETVFDFKLDYFNTASSKIILDILFRLKRIEETGNKILINWHYEDGDEDMHESGEDYQDIVKIPFNFVAFAGDVDDDFEFDFS